MRRWPGRALSGIREGTLRARGVWEGARDPGQALGRGIGPERDRPAEGRRAAPDVDRDVEDLAGDDPDDLALRLPDLIVQAAQHAAPRARVVVLHEVRVQAGGLAERLAVVAFQKEAALVAEDFRLEDENLRDLGRDDLH